MIHPTADVSPDAEIGAGTKIWHQVQIREGARLGERCVISKSVYVDKGVVIGNRVKIQNGVSIYQGVHIEDDVFIGPYSTFTNDIRPRSFSVDWEVVPTFLRRGCSVGANATVMCGVTLGEFSMISAGAVVTVDTLPYGLYIGNPARLKGFVSQSGFEMECVETGSDRLLYICKKSGEELRITFEATKRC